MLISKTETAVRIFIIFVLFQYVIWFFPWIPLISITLSLSFSFVARYYPDNLLIDRLEFMFLNIAGSGFLAETIYLIFSDGQKEFLFML